MTQPDPLDPYDYDVTQTESVQFIITTKGTAPHIHLVLDGKPLPSPYKFPVTKPKPQIHVVTSEFNLTRVHQALPLTTFGLLALSAETSVFLESSRIPQ